MMDKSDKFPKQYLGAIRRRLNMPKAVKDRVMNDFASSITARRECGQTDREIRTELGTPTKVAKELNEQMREFTYRKSPWRWVCLAASIVASMVTMFLAFSGIISANFNSIAYSVGIIGGADGPTAIFVTTSPDAIYYDLVVSLLFLILGVIGYVSLGRCKRK